MPEDYGRGYRGGGSGCLVVQEFGGGGLLPGGDEASAESAKERAEVYDNQVRCNTEILRMGEKLGIKVIATNDVHFLNAEDAEAHDLLICLNTRKDLDDPNRMRYTRQEWFKTTAEMEELFKDIPQVIENTQEIVDKVEDYKLDSDPLMPVSRSRRRSVRRKSTGRNTRKRICSTSLPVMRKVRSL